MFLYVDKNGNRPNHPQYDVGTLQVPKRGDKLAKSESKHFTPAIEQYWEIKQDHFDKIVLFKVQLNYGHVKKETIFFKLYLNHQCRDVF